MGSWPGADGAPPAVAKVRADPNTAPLSRLTAPSGPMDMVATATHEDLRNYGNLEDKNKPLIVSGILLALSEIEHKNFDISDLIGDEIRTDGSKIYKAIEDNLKRANVSPEVKRDKLLNQFNILGL